MNCRDIQIFLPEFAKGYLEGEESRMVERHLEECSNCREELARIQDMLREFEQTFPAHDESPDAYGESIWSVLYTRIRKENLHIAPRGVSAIIRDCIMNYRPGVLQAVNIALITVVGIWFFVSYRADMPGRSGNMIQSMIGESLPETQKKSAEQLLEKKDALVGAIARVAANPEVPFDRIQNFLNRDSQNKLYDSVTDFFADVVIKLSEKS